MQYFQKLPKAPLLEHLSLQQNNIERLDGLELLRKTQLKSLVLKGNPVELDPNYRQKLVIFTPLKCHKNNVFTREIDYFIVRGSWKMRDTTFVSQFHLETKPLINLLLKCKSGTGSGA